MPVQIKADFSDVRKKLGILQENLRAALLQGIAEGVFAITRQSFERQASPEGARWAALSGRYAIWKARRFPGRNILQARGALIRSLFRSVEENQVVVGANLPYAAAHQYGFSGTVNVGSFVRQVKSRDVRGKLGRKRPVVAEGIGAVRAHSRSANLPARPFLPAPETAEREAAQLADEILEDAIRKAGAGP